MYKITEEDISNIIILNNEGHLAPQIAEMVGLPYFKVLKVIKENGGVSRKGRSKSMDGSSNIEQVKALWDSGLHNLDFIAEKLNITRKGVLHILNYNYNIKTRPAELPIDFEAEKLAKRQLEGEMQRGEISALAKKFGVSRQFAHQRVLKAYRKIEN